MEPNLNNIGSIDKSVRRTLTLQKNDGVLQLQGGTIVILGRTASDNMPIVYALEIMEQDGFISPETRVENHITGENIGGMPGRLPSTFPCWKRIRTAGCPMSHGGKILYGRGLSALDAADQ